MSNFQHGLLFFVIASILALALVTVLLLIRSSIAAMHRAVQLYKEHVANENSGEPQYRVGRFYFIAFIGGLVLIFLGMLLGSSPIAYPTLGWAWQRAGLNINDINPLAPPIRGTDFKYGGNKITFNTVPDDKYWVVQILTPDKSGVEEDTIIEDGATEYVVRPDVTEDRVRVYWVERATERGSNVVKVAI